MGLVENKRDVVILFGLLFPILWPLIQPRPGLQRKAANTRSSIGIASSYFVLWWGMVICIRVGIEVFRYSAGGSRLKVGRSVERNALSAGVVDER